MRDLLLAPRKQNTTWQRLNKRVTKLTRSSRFNGTYTIASLLVLATTTIYWSIIGAIIQSSNADQLANTFLFENSQTISNALFPAQHTFLLKMPLFWLISLFGAAPLLFIVATVFCSLITVGGLAFIIWKIDRRPLVFGTIIFALAATLLYIPAQSYPGSLLPANFAMITTRNIEYLLFVGALILFLKSQRLKSVLFILGCIAMGILFASDRLFVSLGFATAIISGLIFILFKRRDYIRVSVKLLIGMAIGYIVAAVMLFLLGRFGVHIGSGSALGPYGLVQGPKDLVIAIVYAVASIFTNLGANPAYDAVAIKDIPAHILSGILSPAGIGYIVTITIAVVALRALIISVVRALLLPLSKRKVTINWQTLLPVILLSTSIGGVAVFTLSNHYYPADSRYLAIVIFAAFIGLAAMYKKTRPKPQHLLRLGLFCIVGVIFGIIFQLQNFYTQNETTAEVSRRDSIVAAALRSHPVSTLIGDYWRVFPIKLDSPSLDVTPLENCTTPRQVLSSTSWQPDLQTTSFAYILPLDGSLANFPNCSLQQITDTYGRPDSSLVIAGTRTQPKELLLFFDEGIHFLNSATPNNTISDTVKPISLDTMPFTTCPNTTIMQFVAHEDDDILFMNPDIANDIKAGNCIRTVFFTAGDAGGDQLYWLGRQRGAEEAYNTMLGTPGLPWTERIISLDATHTITVANPRGNHQVSLIFLHLPDGNPQGTGYTSRHYESLRKLYTRSISTLTAVDNTGETYTFGDLSSALTHLMEVYKPSLVRSQSKFSGTSTKDHSDHNAVGEFSTTAFDAYKQSNPDAVMSYYMGYPVHDLPVNVEGDDYNQKVSTFLSFGKYDAATCRSLAECNNNSVYGIYLGRQYTYPY